MKHISEPTIILLSFVSALVFVYFNIPVLIIQPFIALLLVALLVLLNRFVFSKTEIKYFPIRFILLFITGLSVSLIVFTTGGFYSPFLILFHLFALVLGFLINMPVAVIYLIIAAGSLVINVLVDPRLLGFLTEDASPAVLNFLSFLAIIPLYQALVSRYNIKESIILLLTKQVNLSQLQERTLLRSIPELIIITDDELKILSFNEAVERVLHFSASELIGRPLFDMLYLKDTQGKIIKEDSPLVEQALKERQPFTGAHLLLFSKNKTGGDVVNVQIRPVENLDGELDEVIIVISPPNKREAGQDKLLYRYERLILRQRATLEEFKYRLIEKGLENLSVYLELFGKAEKDLLTSLEIEDRGIQQEIVRSDIASVVRQAVTLYQKFAQNLKVKLELSFSDDFYQNASVHIPEGSTFLPEKLTAPYFTAPVDLKWFDALVQQLLNISVLLASEHHGNTVKVQLSYNKETVEIVANGTCSTLGNGDGHLLWIESYGKLGALTNLRLGSGLEGRIAKSIATSLKIPLQAEIVDHNFTFKLNVPKKLSD